MILYLTNGNSTTKFLFTFTASGVLLLFLTNLWHAYLRQSSFLEFSWILPIWYTMGRASRCRSRWCPLTLLRDWLSRKRRWCRNTARWLPRCRRTWTQTLHFRLNAPVHCPAKVSKNAIINFLSIFVSGKNAFLMILDWDQLNAVRFLHTNHNLIIKHHAV